VRPTIKKLVVASHNEGKVREIRVLLKPYGIDTFSAAELNLPDPEEIGTTFAANAELKAIIAANAADMVALSDDSGLAVDALGGAPGIYSARWGETADGSRDFTLAIKTVRNEMQAASGEMQAGDVPDTARFICALSLAFPGGDVHTYEGKVEGRITWPPRGDKGFGYDPIFVARGDTQTFAQIDPGENKNITSESPRRVQALSRKLAKVHPVKRHPASFLLGGLFIRAVVDADGKNGGAVETRLEPGRAFRRPPGFEQLGGIGADAEIIDGHVVPARDLRLPGADRPAKQGRVAGAVGDAVAEEPDAYIDHEHP